MPKKDTVKRTLRNQRLNKNLTCPDDLLHEFKIEGI